MRHYKKVLNNHIFSYFCHKARYQILCRFMTYFPFPGESTSLGVGGSVAPPLIKSHRPNMSSLTYITSSLDNQTNTLIELVADELLDDEFTVSANLLIICFTGFKGNTKKHCVDHASYFKHNVGTYTRCQEMILHYILRLIFKYSC